MLSQLPRMCCICLYSNAPDATVTRKNDEKIFTSTVALIFAFGFDCNPIGGRNDHSQRNALINKSRVGDTVESRVIKLLLRVD